MPGNIYVHTNQHVNIIYFFLPSLRFFVVCSVGDFFGYSFGFFSSLLDFMLHIVYLILLVQRIIMKCSFWRCSSQEHGLHPGSRWEAGSHVQWSTQAGWAWALPQQKEEGLSDSSGGLLSERDRGCCLPTWLAAQEGFLLARCLDVECYRETAKASPAFHPLLFFLTGPLMLSGRCGANLKCECMTVGVRLKGVEPGVTGRYFQYWDGDRG